jgi:hypothetical protein
MRLVIPLLGVAVVLAAVPSAQAQVDSARAAAHFAEAAELCNRDGGKLWGVSLCGPMVFADAATQTLATNEPKPDAPWPRALGYANAAFDWGGQRWSTYVWAMIPVDDAAARGALLIHELFHRVQPRLELMALAEPVDHLDTLDGRYWLQLEWRALGAALEGDGAARKAAIGDALAFRAARRALFPHAAKNENADEVREGLAQYTGLVVTAADSAAAVRAAVRQLGSAREQPTFVRSFAYSSGAAYGVLLDAYSLNWRRGLTVSSDLAALLAAASGAAVSVDAEAAARRYDAAALRASEERRELERQARVAELTARFIDGPVVTFPRARSASMITTGSMPIPGAGTVFVQYRADDGWGTLDVEEGGVLVRSDALIVPAPTSLGAERSFAGDGWRATIADGWLVRPGERTGDYVIVRAAE